MRGNTSIRALVACAALAIAGAATAQSTEKDRGAAAKQGSTKPSAAKSTGTPKRHDFVPGNSVKETSTRSSTPAPAHAPAKQGSDCESKYSDA